MKQALPRRSKAPAAASPFKSRAQLRKFLQALANGPLINAGRINRGKDVLAAFAVKSDSRYELDRRTWVNAVGFAKPSGAP
jgi:hypothetical protein